MVKCGSMLVVDFSVGMLGANGVVAAGIPIQATLKWRAWLLAVMTAMLLVLTFTPQKALFVLRSLG